MNGDDQEDDTISLAAHSKETSVSNEQTRRESIMGNNCFKSQLGDAKSSPDLKDSVSADPESQDGSGDHQGEGSWVKIIENEVEGSHLSGSHQGSQTKSLSNRVSSESLVPSSRCSSFSKNSLVRYEPCEKVFNHLNQSINLIREKRKKFEDPYFMRTCSSIVVCESSQLYISLKARLGAEDAKQLNKLIIWRRTEVSGSKSSESV